MLSVVLPLYNEEDNIAKVIRTAAEFLRTLKIHFEIIAVDDGSRDRSGEILKKLGLEFPELIVVSHNQNLGYGAALRSGFSQARGELIFFTDSDLQIKIEELGNFLKNIDSYDFVVGYRMNRQDPWHRRL
ncbi:TPA: glycosyltransferase family 2 protein, partial [Candidatus Giovannonibacteria bacterium]|nr:glycosyltransferase family 2 protein [Candidatus Giovannonibacteria bacterium]